MNVLKKDIIEVLNLVLPNSIPEEIDEEEKLLSYGLDSINIIKVIIMLEQKYELEFKDEDLLVERLNTLANIKASLAQYDIYVD